MIDKAAGAALAKRLKEQGLLDLPSVDGDPADHVKAILQGMRQQTPQQQLDNLLAEIAAGMLPTMAHALPELGRPGVVRVHQTIDWRLDAAVSPAPPYVACVSSKLVRFVASMVSALHSGLGIQLVDDEGDAQGEALAPRSEREVARDIKRLLDGFIAEQQVEDTDFGDTPARRMLQFRIFHCTLSWVLAHELGHVVVSESRRQGQPVPFEDVVRPLLEANAAALFADRRYRDRLEGLDESRQAAVREAWLTELNADVIGASLACGYQKDHGISRGVAGIVAVTKFAIHLGLLSLSLLDRYRHLHEPGYPLATLTHPPLDFRMFCVLSWMYKEHVEEASEVPATYATRVFAEVLRQAGYDLY